MGKKKKNSDKAFPEQLDSEIKIDEVLEEKAPKDLGIKTIDEVPEDFEEKPKKKKVKKVPDHYTLGNIGSFTQYNCKYCAYDTLVGEAEIMEHVEASHMVGGKIRLRGVKYDSFGNKIT